MRMKNLIRGEGHCEASIGISPPSINEPETYIRGKDRIDFLFCTLTIASFVTASGITAYDEIAPSNHRGEFLEIQLQKFLANSFQEVTDHTSRKLQTRDSAGVITYKEHLRDFTNTHKIFDRIDAIQCKLEKDIYLITSKEK